MTINDAINTQARKTNDTIQAAARELRQQIDAVGGQVQQVNVSVVSNQVSAASMSAEIRLLQSQVQRLKCLNCSKNTFCNEQNECVACTECGTNEYQASSCSIVRDTVCMPCGQSLIDNCESYGGECYGHDDHHHEQTCVQCQPGFVF
jgi:predicted amino acid dehydrogenase